MSLDFSPLNDNISSILSAQTPLEPTDYVTDFCGKILYSSSSFIGRGWRYLYIAGDFLLRLPRPLEEIKLQRNFKKSEKLFKAALIEIQALNEKISKSYNENNNDGLVTEPLRCASLSIVTSLSSLFDLNTPFSFSKKISLIQHAFQRVLGRPVFSAAEAENLVRFEKSSAMCAVEGILQMPFPLDAFTSLLNGEQTDKAADWILRVKENDKRLSPWLVHQALRGVVDVLLRGKVAEAVLPHELYTLELALHRKGCQILSKDDQLFTQWLNSISPGTVLGERSDIRLGEMLSHDSFRNLGLTVFDRSGYPNQMVVFAKSVALLGMWRTSCLERNAMVPCVEVLMEDPEGKYLVVEKITSSLDQMVWKTKFGQVKEEDKPRCDEIARLLAWLASQDVTPKQLDPAVIFFNSDMRLRTIVPFRTEASHDYTILAQLALKVAARCDLVFRYIMMKSQLIEHPVAKFYVKIAEEHLTNTARLPIGDQASLDEIVDPLVIRRAREMVEALKAIEQNVFRLLASGLTSREARVEEALHQEIIKALIAFQKDMGCPANEWSGSEKTIGDLVKSERPELFRPVVAALPAQSQSQIVRSPYNVFRD